jgi:XTP/dITP diphosphohydrolase
MESKMAEILFASHNSGKLAEIQTLLAPLDVKILSPQEVGISSDFDVDETGSTFAQNAQLKAQAFADQLVATKFTDLWILTDDSGLMIDTLGSVPGVQSKRFVDGDDEDRNNAVLERLANVKDLAKRTAHYETVFCLRKLNSSEEHLFTGQMFGQIGFAPKGTAGFGYDPLFIPSGYTQTVGELGMDVKNKLSHRAQAAVALIKFWQSKVD